MTQLIPETPALLGLPERFQQWRHNQVEALHRLFGTETRIKALSAPTGFGKTLVYIAYALLSKQPTCIVTESRGLQDQLMDAFGEIGLVSLKGKRNYECHMRPQFTCELGHAARCPYKGTIACPSSQAEMQAAVSWLVVTNYDKWTASKKFGQGMDHFTQVIFDEAHKAHAALARAMSVTITEREMDDIAIPLPTRPAAEDFVTWKTWAVEARPIAEQAMKTALSHLLNGPSQPRWVRQFIHLRHLTRRLATLQNAHPANWVADDTREGYQLDPIRPGRYVESALLFRVPSVVFVSATLRPKSLYLLGIGKKTFTYQEYASDFPPARCPIYYVPTMRVDSRAKDLSLLWSRVDQILARRQDRKGIIHTISYARRDQTTQASRFSERMYINSKGDAATDLVELFKASDPGSLLTSPSVGAGFDFPGKDCEFQIILKIPFPDGRSKIMQARQHDDPEYGPMLAMNEMDQIAGRGMRSAQDQCETFIGDMHLDWFMPRYSHLATKTFKARFQRVETLPAPPPRL